MESKKQPHSWAIILAGGDGHRLRHFLKTYYGVEKPKQYCTIIGTRSMLRHTIDRASMHLPPEQIITVINHSHLPFAQHDLGDQLSENVIIQPFGRETGPGILLPLLHIYRRDPDARVVVYPSDHFILEEDHFVSYVQDALEFAALFPAMLITLGVRPDHPKPGYGWIESGLDVERTSNGSALREVRQFWEKPEQNTMIELFEQGCLWNTMVMAGHVRVFLDLFRRNLPEVYNPFRRIDAALGTLGEERVVHEVFASLPSVNFSRAVLERSPEQLGVIPMRDIYWSDWGDGHRVQADILRFSNLVKAYSPIHHSSRPDQNQVLLGLQ